MKQRLALLALEAWCLAIALGPRLSLGAESTEVICLAEPPALLEGESARLRAWAVTPDGKPLTGLVKFQWQVMQGRVESQTADARWDLSAVRVQPGEGRARLRATVKAIEEGRHEGSCSLEVYVGRKDGAAVIDRGTIQSKNVFSAKRYLLPGQTAEDGYALYSYLLLSTPARDQEETARYLKTIEAFLVMLQDVDDYLQRHVRPSRLNATYVPLKKIPAPGKSNAEWAANVLAVYDYAAAEILLRQLDDSYRKGPYLVSVLEPLTDGKNTPTHLSEDLTGVAPELAWDFVTFFTYLAAQERTWSEASLQRFGLTLRNLIAVGGRVAPAALRGVEKAIQFRRGSADGAVKP